MALSNHAYDFEDLHPIDIVEDIATHQEWQFDRIADDQISMEMAGQWRSYSITLAWCEADQTLRLICSFEMDPPAHRMPALYEALNAVNDMSWAGGFTYWGAERLMAYRYGLILSNGQMATPDQIDTMISAAVTSAERYYPAFQMVTWGEKDLETALKVAIADLPKLFQVGSNIYIMKPAFLQSFGCKVLNGLANFFQPQDDLLLLQFH